MKRILMVAFHFPPLAGSSGIQRTLRFAKYLPEFGWEPIVLTTHPRAYEQTSTDLLGEIPKDMVVVRAPAFDAARHFSIMNRYPGVLARPDRWVSWLPGAIMNGLSMIRRYQPNAIWSTYPIATAHLIGASLCRRSELPWIADFRDPMAQNNYPADPRTWQSFKRIEEYAANKAAQCVFTTPGARRLYSERYPDAAERFKVIENGYDEEIFNGMNIDNKPLNSGKITFLHSGIIYPSERNPTHFLQAIRMLIDSEDVTSKQLCVRFRAPIHIGLLESLIHKFDLDAFIELLPPIPYQDALNEMLRADRLLIMQSSGCNEQIPAKLYEYLRANRPIIALTDPMGDTAAVLKHVGISAIAPLNQPGAIMELISRSLSSPGIGALPEASTVTEYSRKNLTKLLAAMLDDLPSR